MPDKPNKTRFERIFLHCSDSEWGTAHIIDSWHKDRGWKEIGYGEVIQNGYPTVSWYNSKTKIPYLEGAAEIGRSIDNDEWFDPGEMGAHVKGYNLGSYGICIIGKHHFTNKVLNAALTCVKYRLAQFNLKPENVLGHYEKDKNKSCPRINMDLFRKNLREGKFYGDKNTASFDTNIKNRFSFLKFFGSIFNFFFKG